MAAADLTGDGRPDLIVANYGFNTVSVLLNTTAPGVTTLSFATQQTFAFGTHPYVVVAADVNGDGRPDLILTDSTSDTVSVLLNTTAPGAPRRSPGHNGSSLNLGSDRPRSRFAAQSLVGALCFDRNHR